MLVVAPYIKKKEADWLCKHFRPGLSITTFTDFSSDAIANASLDVAALRKLSNASQENRVYSVSGLHAKVFVADEHSAIITSGNLTTGGLKRNVEYGVRIDETKLVRQIREDILHLVQEARLLDPNKFDALEKQEQQLREVKASAEIAFKKALRQFANVLQEAFVVPMSKDNKYARFSDAIETLLSSNGPTLTKDMYEPIRQRVPDLCDDQLYHIWRGRPNGKAWKHDVRFAQLILKRKGIIIQDKQSKLWSLS